MAVKYSKAPISDISFGIFFKSNALLRNNILFDLILQLGEEYPIVQTTPTLPFEELQNGNISQVLDQFNSGIIAHWLNSKDFIYKVYLLQNAMIFYWNRRDDMPSVSRYPGYSSVFEKFSDVCEKMNSIASERSVDLKSDIRLYSLTYQDRVNPESYKNMGVSLKDVLTLNNPFITFGEEKYLSENCVCKYSINLPYLNGYSITSINTPTFPGQGQAILVENKIKGYLESMAGWFDLAHQSQLSFFESIFTESVLKNWE